jgi:hypothetical protein
MESREVSPICSFKEFESKLGDYVTYIPTLLSSKQDLTITDAETKNPICILRKKVLPKDVLETTVFHYLPIVKKMQSANRGFAAGNKERVQREKYERSNPVYSTIAGYIDSPNNKYPCRLTQFSKKHMEAYQQGIPFINKIDEIFKETLPERYEAQKKYADKTNYRIENTVFTTITMNYNFQTAVHVDKGDCKEGFGILVVDSKNIRGGNLLFPRYQFGISVEPGDILFMNVHEYHCNDPIHLETPEGYRLSFVCYLRERLLDCRHNEVLKEIGVEEGKHWNTDLLVQKIVEKMQHPPPGKVFSEENTKDWHVETDRYRLVCKKRQYNFYDKVEKKRVQSLYNIWNYLTQKE